MERLEKIRTTLDRLLGLPQRLATARAPVRPIVIIQSDDWGRVGIPSIAILDDLRRSGFPVGMSSWDRYGLESADDVDALAEILAECRDADGRAACVTANFVMANADLRRMEAEGWKAFRWIPIHEGFPAPWNEKLLPSYKRAVDKGVFYPGLHGFTHFNPSGLVSALNDPGELGIRARALATRDVPYLRSITPEYNFALAKCDLDGDHFLDRESQAEWLENGVRLFEQTFGFRPCTVCAPGYRENDVTRELYSRAGISVTQGRYGDVPFDEKDLLFLGRNVAFEPSLGEPYTLKHALAEITQVIAAGSPVVICSHSINYVSRFVGQAEVAREQLAQLLTELKSQYPDLRFTSDHEFSSAWANHEDTWFRPPTSAEKFNRTQRFIQRLGASSVFQDEEHQPGVSSRPRKSASLETGISANLVGSEPQDPFDHSAITSRLGGQTLFVLLGSIFTLIVGFPLQIYVSRMLGPEGIGTFGLVEGAVATISGFLGLGIAQTAVRFIPFHLAQKEYASIREIVRIGALVLTAVGSGAYLAVLVSFDLIANWYPRLTAHGSVLVVMAAMIPLGLLLYFLQQALRGFHEIKYMVIGSSILRLAIKAVITVLVFAVGWGLFGYALAVVLSTCCSVLWMGFGLRQKLATLPTPASENVRSNRLQWQHYALIAYFGGLLSFTAYIDRFILGYFVGSAAVGIFLIARQLQQLPGMFNQMLIMVGAPMIAAAHSRKSATERQHIYTLMTDWVVRASMPLMIFLFLFGDAVLALFGPDFVSGGRAALYILVAAQFVNLVCGPVGNVLMMSGMERPAVRVSTATTLFDTVMVVTLTPFLGLIGAALASAASWVFSNAVSLMLARRQLDIRWWDSRLRGWILPTIVISVLGLAIRGLPTAFGAVQLFAILTIMYGVFALVNLKQGLHRDDKDLLRYVRLQFLRWKYA